jgi:hypothetical protein
MPEKRTPYVPTMDNAAVKAKTGRDWAGWFSLLDKAGAAKLEHKAIVALLSDKHAVPSWWRQMVAVEYERARGLREPHETATGFSVSVSKTIAVSLSELYAATAAEPRRKQWFPKGKFAVSSQTKDKYFRGAWNDSSRLEMGFYAKGPGKSQIAIQIGKLPDRDAVESERTAWGAAVEKLKGLMEAGQGASHSTRGAARARRDRVD